jgi:ankyrin repeat protein
VKEQYELVDKTLWALDDMNFLKRLIGKLEERIDSSALRRACYQSNLGRVKFPIAECVDVNKQENKYAHTALMAAASKGLKEVAELLIAGKADVNVKDSDGHTALAWAIHTGNTAVADLLREHGGQE